VRFNYNFSMTYIEFFDKIASENISACLTYVPDRVIYLGDNAKVMKKHIANYQRVFSDRGYNIEFSFKTISKSNLDNAIQMLTEIVETYDDCVFDITGGEEILTLALGVVYANHPDKNIQIHKFNLRNNAIYDCDKDGVTIAGETPTLSVEENVRIYGGDVVYGGISEEKTYKWDLNDDFRKDIDTIWSVCKGNVRYWNTIIGIFEAIEIVGSIVCEEPLTTIANRSALETYLTQHKVKYKMSSGIVKYLMKNGLLIEFNDSDEKLILSKIGEVFGIHSFLVAYKTKTNEESIKNTISDMLNSSFDFNKNILLKLKLSEVKKVFHLIHLVVIIYLVAIF